MSYDRLCIACDAPIRFQRVPGGRSIPVSVATGRSHFEDCPSADKFRANSSDAAIDLCPGSRGKPAVAPPGPAPRGQRQDATKGTCPHCDREFSLSKSGRLHQHAPKPSQARAARSKPTQASLFQ